MKKLMFAAAVAAIGTAFAVESGNVVGYKQASLANGINFQVPQFQGMNTLDGGVTLSAIVPSGTNFRPGKDTLTLKQNGNKFIIKGDYNSVFTYIGASDLATAISLQEATIEGMYEEEADDPGTYEQEEFEAEEAKLAAMKAATPGWFLYSNGGPAYSEGSYNAYSVPAGAGFMFNAASSVTLTIPSAL